MRHHKSDVVTLDHHFIMNKSAHKMLKKHMITVIGFNYGVKKGPVTFVN